MVKGTCSGPNTSVCKHHAHHEKAYGCPNIFETKKNHAPVRYEAMPKRFSQITVYADKVHLVEHGDEHQCHDDGAHEEAQHHLHIRVTARRHGTGHGDEG